MREHSTDEIPKIHSRISIIVFSTLLSPIFGGIMYWQNLTATDNKQYRTSMILFCLIWQFIAAKLVRDVTDNILLSVFLPNIIGGLILAKPFWDYHFKDDIDVTSRSLWTPALIVLIIYGGLFTLHFIL